MSGWVYFIQVGGADGAIKIGHARNVRNRLIQLQISSPQLLSLIGTHRGGLDLEREFHERFREFHIRGEWFSPAPPVIAAAGTVPRAVLDGHSVSDGHAALRAICRAPMYIQRGIKGRVPPDPRMIGHMILVACGLAHDYGDIFRRIEARKHLRSIGIFVEVRMIWFADSSDTILQPSAHSKWHKRWSRDMLAIEGAAASRRRLGRPSDPKVRAIGVPIAWAIDTCRRAKEAHRWQITQARDGTLTATVDGKQLAVPFDKTTNKPDSEGVTAQTDRNTPCNTAAVTP